MPHAVLANIGAEEPDVPALPVTETVARLFARLFPADATRADGGDFGAWPEALGAPATDAAFAWLRADALHAWLADDAAARVAAELDRPLAGPGPDVVRLVHDKAFAARTAEAEGYVPRSQGGLAHIFEPAELEDGDAAARSVVAAVAEWPAWIEGRYTLKPRFGSSGRGRFGGTGTELPPELAAACRGLASRGGAILEPWLERESDLSAQLQIAPDGTVTLLGMLALTTSASGVYRGHSGRLDHRHRVSTGLRAEPDVLEAALALARAAHAEGFHGPCGLDAFTFRGEHGPELRPVVEWNARFTMGTLVLGLLRRARPRIHATLGPTPGTALEFSFALGSPEAPRGPDSVRLALDGATLDVWPAPSDA